MGSLTYFRPVAAYWLAGVALLASLAFSLPAQAEADCSDVATNPYKIGVSRVIEIDASTGPLLGKMTTLHHQPDLLAPYEVVLTFDDGPMPWITRSILATLDRHCTRATFFNVGQMALAYPNVVREVLDHGHTVGSHTWSHPLNLRRLGASGAQMEIEKGFAAVAAAAGRPIAPFFRFPGLSDSIEMMGYLAGRHVAAFTVDVVSNDSYIGDAERLKTETLAKIDANHGGIILFHDIKASTAKALPEILDALAARGYSVVHLVPKDAMQPKSEIVQSFEAQVAKRLAEAAKAHPGQVPFYGLVGPSPKPAATVETAKFDKASAPRATASSWSTRVKRGD